MVNLEQFAIQINPENRILPKKSAIPYRSVQKNDRSVHFLGRIITEAYILFGQFFFK